MGTQSVLASRTLRRMCADIFESLAEDCVWLREARHQSWVLARNRNRFSAAVKTFRVRRADSGLSRDGWSGNCVRTFLHPRIRRRIHLWRNARRCGRRVVGCVPMQACREVTTAPSSFSRGRKRLEGEATLEVNSESRYVAEDVTTRGGSCEGSAAMHLSLECAFHKRNEELDTAL